MWPNKKEREDYEICEFIRHYNTILLGHRVELVEMCDNPDAFVKDVLSKEIFGVELTSVYLDNKSVPGLHMNNEQTEIKDEIEKIDLYKKRIIKSVLAKKEKASQYNKRYSLILSIYVNEYVSIFMDKTVWYSFVNKNQNVFENISPFIDIVFWPLGNDSVFSMKYGMRDKSKKRL